MTRQSLHHYSGLYHFGIFYHFIDRQIKIEKEVLFSYINLSKKIISQDGIQHSSQIEIEFDPSKETVLLHTVNVQRGTQTINHLDPKKIRILQREKELEDNIYSGIKSLSIILDDIRVGDTINYSYTRKEKNIKGKNEFYDKAFFTISPPVSFYQYRVLWPTDRKISLKSHGNMPRAHIKKQGNYTDYRWTRLNIKGFEWEPSTPRSFECRDFIEVADQLSWSTVNASMADLYKTQLPLSPELQKYITDLSKTTTDKEKQFITVMRFV